MKLVNLSIKICIGIILCTIVLSNSSENQNEISSTSSSSSASELNLNHGIFLNDKLFKYKNAKKALSKSKNKNLAKNKNTSTLNMKGKSANTNLSKTNLKKTPGNNNNKASNNAASQSAHAANQNNPGKTKQIEGPILHKGWIKYFKYSGKEGNGTKHPDSFKENRQFFEQPKYFPNANLKQKKDGQYEFIRDANFFFLHLFENNLSINSSLHVRENKK